MTPLLGLALQAVPELINAFTGDDKKKPMEVVGTIAQKVVMGKLGVRVDGDDNRVEYSDEELIDVINSDPKLMIEFRTELEKNKFRFDEIALNNTKDARNMYASTGHRAADNIAKSIINYNLWFVFALVFAQMLAMYLLSDHGQLLALLGNTVGFVLNGLLKERQDVVNFFFGSSLGSKIKDKVGKNEVK